MFSYDNDLDMETLIEQHLNVLRAQGMSPLTIRDRGRCLRRLHDDLPHGILYAVTEQLQEWLSYDRWSRWTRRTYTNHVLAFYRWLHRSRYLLEDPTADMRPPRPPAGIPRPASEEQLAVALTAPEPIRTAVILAAYGGLRRSEIAACHREHITEETVLIPRAKGGDAETVPCHPVIWEHIRDRPDGPLIADAAGQQLHPDVLSRLVRRWARSVGLAGWGLHRLRHRYGTVIQREGRDLRVTQECLRHKSISSTQVYTQVTDDQRRAAVLRLAAHRAISTRPVPPAEAG